MHAFNRDLDRKLVRPVSKGYDAAIPDDIENAILRFSQNTSLPGAIVNNVLQLNMRGAIQDTARLFVNTTVGLGGLFDPASEMGMPAATDADFGQTLHVWGAEEGAYIELPILGPSTQRDTFGTFVDFFTNPLSYVTEGPRPASGSDRTSPAGCPAAASSRTRSTRFSTKAPTVTRSHAPSTCKAADSNWAGRQERTMMIPYEATARPPTWRIPMTSDTSRRSFVLSALAVAGTLLAPLPAQALTEARARALVDQVVGDINDAIDSSGSQAAMIREFERIFGATRMSGSSRARRSGPSPAVSNAQMRAYTEPFAAMSRANTASVSTSSGAGGSRSTACAR